MEDGYEEGSWQDAYMEMGCGLPYCDDESECAEREYDTPDAGIMYVPHPAEIPGTGIEPDIIAPDAIPVELIVPDFGMAFGR